jgi:hypothetical protein
MGPTRKLDEPNYQQGNSDKKHEEQNCITVLPLPHFQLALLRNRGERSYLEKLKRELSKRLRAAWGSWPSWHEVVGETCFVILVDG